MANAYIVDIGMNDSLQDVIRKSNKNFRMMLGRSNSISHVEQDKILDDVTYANLPDKPSIEDVELINNKDFPDLGIFRIDDQGYDIPDEYTLDSIDINTLWNNAIPIQIGG